MTDAEIEAYVVEKMKDYNEPTDEQLGRFAAVSVLGVVVASVMDSVILNR